MATMLEIAARKVIRDTKMNRLVWEYETDDQIFTTAEIKRSEFEEGVSNVLVVFKRAYQEDAPRPAYYLSIGEVGLNESYKPILDFGRYMFGE